MHQAAPEQQNSKKTNKSVPCCATQSRRAVLWRYTRPYWSSSSFDGRNTLPFRSFVRSFVRSFIRSFVRSFVRSSKARNNRKDNSMFLIASRIPNQLEVHQKRIAGNNCYLSFFQFNVEFANLIRSSLLTHIPINVSNVPCRAVPCPPAAVPRCAN